MHLALASDSHPSEHYQELCPAPCLGLCYQIPSSTPMTISASAPINSFCGIYYALGHICNARSRAHLNCCHLRYLLTHVTLCLPQANSCFYFVRVKFCKAAVITEYRYLHCSSGILKDINIVSDDVGIFSPHFKLVYKPVLEGRDGNNVSRLANVWQNYVCQCYFSEWGQYTFIIQQYNQQICSLG